MKITALLLLTACLQVSARGYTQTVTLKLQHAPLEEVFNQITVQTGYNFLYFTKQLTDTKPITIDVTNQPLEKVLEYCFKDQPLTFSVSAGEKVVVIKDKKVVNKDKNEGGAPTEINGRVTNAQGEPLSGASIVIKRTGKGTITDANGNFVLKGLGFKNDDILQVSFIGYKTISIQIGSRNNYTLIMELATNDLDKVVVQAYGTTSQRIATGNIGKVTAEEIAKQPVMNPLLALQGQIAGVVVTQTTGDISGTVKVEIRGRNSINPNLTSDPLYIIDGVPLTILELNGKATYNNGSFGFSQTQLPSPAGTGGQSPFFSINPADIESIEVLKDADATAIYGSRGANGVILITTKKGKAGKTKFDLNVQQGVSQIIRYYKMLNTQQYVAMRKEALKNDGLPIDINQAPDLVAWDTTRNTDWQKYIWGSTGKVTDVQASLSGGDARTTFRVGSSYRNQTDILTASGIFQRGTLSFDLQHKSVNQRLSFQMKAGYSFVTADEIYMPDAALLPPNAPPIYDKAGNLNYAGWSPLQDLYPFGNFLMPYNSKTSYLGSNLIVGYQIVKGLSARVSFGYNNFKSNQTSTTTIASQDPTSNPKGTAQFGVTSGINLSAEPQIEYNGFINKGKINILIGGSLQNATTDGLYVSGSGYTNDALLGTVSNAPNKAAVENYSKYKYAAVFGRLNYNWQNKYIINLNIRRDGSSRFGPGKQFGNFGSLGAAWVFSEEGWFKNALHLLSFGKLRGSYGITGSDNIGNYKYLSLWSSSGTYPYNGVTALIPQGHTDSLFQWEVNRKIEMSLIMGMLKDRFTLEIAWYRNRCDNQLVSFPIPNYTGFNTVVTNSPANVENSGWEFTLNSKILDNHSLKWVSNFKIGINRNKLLAYPNIALSPYASSLVIGQSLNMVKLLHVTGIDPLTGLYSFQDKNNDGVINTNRNSPLSDFYYFDLSPKFDGGFTNTISYKEWEFSFFFYFKKYMAANALSVINVPGTPYFNQPIEVLNHWQKPGDVTSRPRFTTGNGFGDLTTDNNFRQFSDGAYTDASYVRLQNLTLSYSFRDKLLKKLGTQSCRVSLQAANLFYITKYKGLDPELPGFGVMPLPRTIIIGISCNF